MPRLSLYRPEKGNDYRFIDKTIWEMFQVGGTDVLIHKYLGPGGTATEPSQSGTVEDPFRIQDVLFLENRDRKYSPDVYVMRGVYNIQDIDFNLSQFGLFLQNDTIFITFHITDTIEKIGRKLISGDVIELPHLKDDHALNDLSFALKRFYVIEDVNRAAEGFSVTWYPHLYRAKCKPLVDSQEFKDILDKVANPDGYLGSWNSEITYYPGDIVTGTDEKNYTVIKEVTGISPPNIEYYELSQNLRDILSTYEKEMEITAGVLDLAEADAPKSGYDTTKFYTLQRDEAGRAELVTVDTETIDASLEQQGVTASTMLQTAEQNGYQGYLTQDGVVPNGAPFTAGIAFPSNPIEGQFHLRNDYLPNRLFRYSKNRWSKVEDNLRMTMSNLGSDDVAAGAPFEGKDVRKTQKTSFINNDNVNIIDGKPIKEKQSLSKALRPEADE